MELRYRDLSSAELERLREIDRAEHITTTFAMQDGALVSRAVDWDDQGWQEGIGEHSFEHQVAFCRGHAAVGGWQRASSAGRDQAPIPGVRIGGRLPDRSDNHPTRS